MNLYIHIPFCHRRCSYCDFNTYANMDDRLEAYVQALCNELLMLAALYPPDQPAFQPSIFFGGGTPSMLTLNQMERILDAADTIVPLTDAEITMEANPGSVLGNAMPAVDYLRGMRALGVNRLSLGVQTLDDPTLRVLGRIHTAADARRCVEDARQAGFDNLNLDFIFGLPGQTLEQWDATLAEIVTWGSDHFSLYSLILEERTPLYAQVTAGHVSIPDDDTAGAMYELAMERFAAAGYTQYEISNWAKPATPAAPLPVCFHNSAYWLNLDYLAAGAGAHGHVYPERYYNILGIDDYITAVRAGERPIAGTTPLTHRDLCAETMFMGLRLNQGVAFDHFAQRCGITMDEVDAEVIADLVTQGLLLRDDSGVRLTDRGRMLGNRVFERFV